MTVAELQTTLACEEDKEFFERELDSFLPDKIFDAHCHLGTVACAPWLSPFGDTDYRRHLELTQDLHPRRQTAALFIPTFDPARESLLPQANEWISKQIAQDASCRGEL